MVAAHQESRELVDMSGSTNLTSMTISDQPAALQRRELCRDETALNAKRAACSSNMFCIIWLAGGQRRVLVLIL